MIHAEDPGSERYSVIKDGRYLTGVSALDPDTGEIIQFLQGNFGNPLLKWLLGLTGISVYTMTCAMVDARAFGSLHYLVSGDEILKKHYFLPRPFTLEVKEP